MNETKEITYGPGIKPVADAFIAYVDRRLEAGELKKAIAAEMKFCDATQFSRWYNRRHALSPAYARLVSAWLTRRRVRHPVYK